MTDLPPAIPKVFPFQSSVETVRAHHWRHFTDLYTGCAFNCQYCLYKGPGDYGAHVHPVESTAAPVPAGELGILDIGATTDPYQELERDQGRTRRLLEVCDRYAVSVFVLTRGTLVTRDLDVLGRLAAKGLVEVCFSLISLREAVSAALEPGAPPPHARVEAARTLSAAGIPVSFHVAPLIPGLDSADDRAALAETLVAAGASHLFLAMLGARSAFWRPFLDALARPGVTHDPEAFERAYDRISFARAAAVTCDMDTAGDSMAPLLDVARAHRLPAVSENYPGYTTGSLDGGIYRSKLPTVYDMSEWIRQSTVPVSWEWFHTDYYAAFRPPPTLVHSVRTWWHTGELFEGCRIRPAGGGAYQASEMISPAASRTLVARRGAQ